ncbi:DUF4333 domain-containing protein [Tumidithrix elongata RA019]|uniref:DUF4333 domain-containing protein n=1 Tax=Tumidithrix elongata BACA0141 TaxID=2716417 RepID=A0AAW9PQ38_9CYAN|nr:DUF4333 domain-containing protein [Tumidithrix elongata RA019]
MKVSSFVGVLALFTASCLSGCGALPYKYNCSGGGGFSNGSTGDRERAEAEVRKAEAKGMTCQTDFPADSTTQTSTATPATPVASAKTSSKIQVVEKEVKDYLVQNLGVDVAISCPQDIVPAKGKEFDCNATAAEGKFAVAVKLQDAEGNKFDLNTKGLLKLPLLEELIQKNVKEQNNVDVKVNCGGAKIKITKVGDVFTCKVKIPDGTVKDATITVKDEAGGVSWKI